MNINEIRSLIGLRKAALHKLYMAGAYKNVSFDEFVKKDTLITKLKEDFKKIHKRTKKADR